MANLEVVKISGSETQARKAFKDMKNRATVIASTKGTFYAKYPSQESSWANKIMTDLGLKLTRITNEEIPKHYKASCGTLTTSQQHQARCKSCRSLIPTKPSKPRQKHGEVKTVFKLPGLDKFDLTGLTEFLSAKQEEAFEISAQLSDVVESLKKSGDLVDQIAKLQKEHDEYRKALKFFLKEEAND